mgnify:CR=1 FL=1
MKRFTATAILFLLAFQCLRAQEPFSAKFQEKTLRVDYVFSGNDRTSRVHVDELRSLEGWAGRRVNMDRVLLKGNGQVEMRDSGSGELLYVNSFSTLFQEWQATEEATKVDKAFENVFLFPMPKAPVEITVRLFDFKGGLACSFTHPVDPEDMLIRPAGGPDVKYSYLHRGGSGEKCIDVVVVAEGYARKETGAFMKHAREAVYAIFSHEPFGSMKDRFNFIAVPLVS